MPSFPGLARRCVILAVALTACATRVSFETVHVEVEGSGRTARSVDPVALSQVRALHLEPVVVEGSGGDGLAAVVRQILIEECGVAHPIVDRPGEGVAAIRVRVSGLSRADGEGAWMLAGFDLRGARVTAIVLAEGTDEPIAFVSEVLSEETEGPSLTRWGRVEGLLVAWARELAARLR